MLGRTGHSSLQADSMESSFSADVEPLGTFLEAFLPLQAQGCK